MGKEWYDGMLDEPVVVGMPVPKVWEEQVCRRGHLPAPGAMLPGTPPVETIGGRHRQIASPAFSVLRTGAGDLELLAGGDLRMKSPFGVYTAGTQAAGTRPSSVRARAVSAEDGKVLDKRSQDYESWWPATTGSTAPGIRSAAATCWCRPRPGGRQLEQWQLCRRRPAHDADAQHRSVQLAL